MFGPHKVVTAGMLANREPFCLFIVVGIMCSFESILTVRVELLVKEFDRGSTTYHHTYSCRQAVMLCILVKGGGAGEITRTFHVYISCLRVNQFKI